MEETVTFQPIQVMAVIDGGQGQLVLAGGRLVAVLVRLTDLGHGNKCEHWFLEAGFGPCSTVLSPVFPDLGTAESWVRQCLGNH